MDMGWRAALLIVAGVAGLGSVALAGRMTPGGQDNYSRHDEAGGDEPSAAQGPAWIFQGDWLGAGADADGSLWYVEQIASDFTAWPLRVIARAHHPRGGPYDWTQRELEIDCQRHRYRILRTIRQGLAGPPAELGESGDAGFRETEQGSGIERVKIFVCEGPDNLPGRRPSDEWVGNSM
jgi:hypothetical protein